MDALNRKEAIIMGDDITPVTREEYCLKELAAGGGSGSLDYVVPEQTATVVYDETLQKYIAVVENVNVSELYDDQALFAKLTFPILGEVVCPATFTENTIELSVPGGMTIKKESGDFGRWYIEFSAEVLGAEYPIAVIKGF